MPRPTRAAIRKAIKRTAEIVGDTPLDFMLMVMRCEDNDIATRLEAAKAAAPFVHRKLATLEVTGEGGGPLVVKIVKFADASVS